MMSKETAKEIVDLLFRLYDEDKEGAVINHHTHGIILDFIGGEPFMNVDVIESVHVPIPDAQMTSNLSD